MAIVKSGQGGSQSSLAAARGAKSPAKAAKHSVAKHAARKHAAKKHAAKKHAAKKHAGKHAAKHAAGKHAANSSKVLEWTESSPRQEEDFAALSSAYHHLQRAGAVISLLEKESGGDLRGLLEHGIELYRNAYRRKRTPGTVQCALGLLRAAEHLGMAGLYSARSEHRIEVTAPARDEIARHLEELGPRLDRLSQPRKSEGERLEQMARELLRRADAAGDDPHLEYELTMAADGICTALEAGL